MGDEVCDDGPSSEACPDCTEVTTGWSCVSYPCTPVCDDSLVVGNEVCDTGNDIGCDSCTGPVAGYNCDTLPCRTVCGDEILVGDEVCDSPQGCEDCSAAIFGWDCSVPLACVEIQVCGDEYISSVENCEDGNTNNDDGCDSSCMEESGWDCNTSTGDNGHQTTTCSETCGDN